MMTIELRRRLLSHGSNAVTVLCDQEGRLVEGQVAVEQTESFDEPGMVIVHLRAGAVPWMDDLAGLAAVPDRDTGDIHASHVERPGFEGIPHEQTARIVCRTSSEEHQSYASAFDTGRPGPVSSMPGYWEVVSIDLDELDPELVWVELRLVHP